MKKYSIALAQTTVTYEVVSVILHDKVWYIYIIINLFCQAFNARCVYPLGGRELTSGYKGYGLGAMVELFCGILGGTENQILI